MRPSKSQGGPDRGRMKNAESGHRIWLETMDHMIQLKQVLEADKEKDETEDKHDEHKDHGSTRKQRF